MPIKCAMVTHISLPPAGPRRKAHVVGLFSRQDIIENVSVCPPTPSPHPAGAHLWWGKGPDGGPDGGHDGGHHFLKNEKK